jgi:hypothetical protein
MCSAVLLGAIRRPPRMLNTVRTGTREGARSGSGRSGVLAAPDRDSATPRNLEHLMRTRVLHVGLFIALCTLISGCQVSDSKVNSTVLAPASAINSFILMDDTRYFGVFAAALAKEGFTLRPVATRAVRSEQSSTHSDQTSTSVRRTFGEAGDQYALRLDLQATNQTCVFSSSRGIRGTLTVLDLEANTTLMVLEAEGPDGECPPLTPIWDLFARSLRENLPR